MDAYETLRAALISAQHGNTDITAALAALAELERAAKVPVAWMWEWDHCGKWISEFSRVECPPSEPHRRNITPLYTAPPPAPGMFTAEEMEAAWIEARGLLTTVPWKHSATYRLIRKRTK